MGKKICKEGKETGVKIAMVFGTFDLLHKGHINLFRQAKKHGKVVAVIARDKTIVAVKTRKPVQNEKTRLRKVKKYVGKALLGSLGNKYNMLSKIKPDLICLGYDQKSFTKNLGKELKKRKINAKIIRLKPYKSSEYKTKIIRKSLGK